MAIKPKSEEVKEVKLKVEEFDFQKENDELRKELEILKKQMQSFVASANQFTPTLVAPLTYEEKEVEVISLTNANLILSTTGKSDGRMYEFSKQYDTLLIPESDLKEIVRNMPNTTKNGSFYINDSSFIEKNRLRYIYNNLMNVNQMKEILNKNKENFIASYNNAPEGQKSIIQSMVTDKLLKGEFVDANILMFLKEVTKIDFTNIEPLMKED